RCLRCTRTHAGFERRPRRRNSCLPARLRDRSGILADPRSLSSLLTAAKRFPEERSILQSRLDKDPGNRQIKEQLIRVEAEIGGLDAGLSKARSFAKDDPGSPLYDIVSADLYEKGAKRPEAIALLEKAAAARSSDD